MLTGRVVATLLIFASASIAFASEARQAVFDVYLDDKRIGTHSYEFVRSGDTTVVASDAVRRQISIHHGLQISPPGSRAVSFRMDE